ncbi:hypothetical protein BH10BAC1_BH10BAC1_03390 [soil metagenome]
MTTTTMFSNCLTLEQLQSYSLNKSENEERARLYMHISNCELCSCAVNGFTAISFTSADVDAIHHQIDVKTNAMHANPLTFAHIFISVVSLASIFGFYQFANSFSGNKSHVVANEIIKSVSFPLTETIIPAVETEELPVTISSEERAIKQELLTENKIVEKISIPVELIKSIDADLIPIVDKTPEILVEPIYNADIIYIYDLKVTNYNALYFNYQPKVFEIKGATPSFKENKESSNSFEKDYEQTIAADKVLKSGLTYFTKGKYSKALGEFLVLLENNPKDVNSLFYSAICYNQIGKYDKTIKNLEAVLKSTNNVFHPEAKWNLALSYLKVGEKARAKQLFIEIANEKGFYSKRATDKLKSSSF